MEGSGNRMCAPASPEALPLSVELEPPRPLGCMVFRKEGTADPASLPKLLTSARSGVQWLNSALVLASGMLFLLSGGR